MTEMRWSYDVVADALYVQFLDAPVLRTMQIGTSIMVDVAEADALVGVEVVAVTGADLEGLTRLPREAQVLVAHLVRFARDHHQVESSTAVIEPITARVRAKDGEPARPSQVEIVAGSRQLQVA